MKATILHAPRDVRLEEVEDPRIVLPTDAVVDVTASCVCGSDLWPYRGINDVPEPRRIGHEYVGVVREVGSGVRSLRPGDFVISPFTISDNTCAHCQVGMQTACTHLTSYGSPDRDGHMVDACQGEAIRVPFADGTLVSTREMPSPELIPSLLTLSDVMGTGWHAAVSANVREGDTVVVVGDGAVGLCGVLAARQLGAERIIAMSRHEPRQMIAREFGATDIVEERGEDGVAKVKELTGGLGAHSVIEAVGTQEAMMQAIHSTRPGGHVGFVGVSHDVAIPGDELFMAGVHIHGGPAPVRQYLPELIQLIWDRTINPGKVFDLTLPLEKAAEGYQAMDQRTAIKVLLTL